MVIEKKYFVQKTFINIYRVFSSSTKISGSTKIQQTVNILGSKTPNDI